MVTLPSVDTSPKRDEIIWRGCQVASSVVPPLDFPFSSWFVIASLVIRFMPIFGGSLRDPNRRRRPSLLFRDSEEEKSLLSLFLLP